MKDSNKDTPQNSSLNFDTVNERLRSDFEEGFKVYSRRNSSNQPSLMDDFPELHDPRDATALALFTDSDYDKIDDDWFAADLS